MDAMTLPATQSATLSSQEKLMAFVQGKYPQYHPVIAMIELAETSRTMGDTRDMGLEFSCHKEVAKYVLKVDKHVEIKADVNQTKRVIVELFGDGEQKDQPTTIENDPSPGLGISDVVSRPVRASVMEHVGQAEAVQSVAEEIVEETGSQVGNFS